MTLPRMGHTVPEQQVTPFAVIENRIAEDGGAMVVDTHKTYFSNTLRIWLGTRASKIWHTTRPICRIGRKTLIAMRSMVLVRDRGMKFDLLWEECVRTDNSTNWLLEGILEHLGVFNEKRFFQGDIRRETYTWGPTNECKLVCPQILRSWDLRRPPFIGSQSRSVANVCRVLPKILCNLSEPLDNSSQTGLPGTPINKAKAPRQLAVTRGDEAEQQPTAISSGVDTYA